MLKVTRAIEWDGVQLELLNTLDPERIAEYAERSTAWINDPEINQYLGREGTTLEQSVDWLHSMRSKVRTDRSYAIWFDDQHIGNCGLHYLDPNGLHAGVGILIGDPSCHGRGIGTTVMHALANHALVDWQLGKLWLHVFDHNERGIACYTNVGYEEVGRQKNHAIRADKPRAQITMELDGDRYHARHVMAQAHADEKYLPM